VKNEFDLTLSILCAITPRGWEWTRQELADFCGCTPQYIAGVEKNAMQKLKNNPKAKELDNE